MRSVPDTIGPYRIQRLLGEGGMGCVYEGVHQAIERRVAIKTLKPELAQNQEAVTRFFNEARAVNRIEHPSLVQIYDYGQTAEGVAYLVMEYLRGDSLRSRLHRQASIGQRLSWQHAVQIAWQIAEALTAAHEKGIVHRDLKPDNVMLISDPAVSGGERAKVLDFGIAKLMQSSQVLTVAAKLMGTPLYMSPEQCRGEIDIDGRTDVYALGVILYEILAGEAPFRSENLEGMLAQQLFFEPQPLSSLAPQASTQVVELVHRMLRKDKHQRPLMRTVMTELSRLMSVSSRPQEVTVAVNLNHAMQQAPRPPSTMGQSHGQQIPGPARPFRWLMLLAGMGLLLGGGWFLRSQQHSDPTEPRPPAGTRRFPVTSTHPADVADGGVRPPPQKSAPGTRPAAVDKALVGPNPAAPLSKAPAVKPSIPGSSPPPARGGPTNSPTIIKRPSEHAKPKGSAQSDVYLD